MMAAIATVTSSSSSPRSLEHKQRERARARSKALYGNKDRAEVSAAIARSPDGLVNATDLALETGLINPRVRAQLLALVAAGLLSEIPPTGTDSKRWYLRRESPFWPACLELYDEWTR